jgi:hypothetical protein
MATTISRRRLLTSALGAAAALGLGGCALPAPRQGDVGVEQTAVVGGVEPSSELDPAVASIVSLIRSEYHYLDLGAIDLPAFAREFQQKAGQRVLETRESDPESFAYAVNTQFLMSTDFFLNGGDEAQALTYRGYFDLYNGCRSPFASFEFS